MPRMRAVRETVGTVAAAIPFLVSMAAHAVDPVPREPAPPDEPRPALVFDQYLVDLGRVRPQRYLVARFGFTNRSDRTVRVTELEPSCGCLNPRLPKRVYEPGESGEFFVRVVTANEDPGPQQYFVTVRYEDPRPREVELAFQVTLPERALTIRPKALIMYQMSDRPVSQDVVILDSRRGASSLRLTGMECTSKWARVERGDVEKDSAGNRKLTVRVTVPGEVPAGRHQGMVLLRTNDPEYPTLRVPLLVQGPEPNAVRAAGTESGAANDEAMR